MSKSNRGGLTGRRSGGTVTVIEEPVRRSAVRKAKIVFWICWITIGLLSATVLASKWHPILALLAGMAIGLVAAAVIAALVIAWPVLRALWWWTPEIGLTLGLVTGWVDLADHTTLPIRLAVVVSITGVPAAIPQVRRRIVATVWCLITRHRIRTCFTEFIITNRTGSLPFLLLTIPTSVGERVWIWLRPGLALVRHSGPARPDRRGLLGRCRDRRIGLGVQLGPDPAGHQTPRRPHRRDRLPAARARQARHPTPGPGPRGPARAHRAGPARRQRRRRHPTTQAHPAHAHAHPGGQENTRPHPGPDRRRPRRRRLPLTQSPGAFTRRSERPIHTAEPQPAA